MAKVHDICIGLNQILASVGGLFLVMLVLVLVCRRLRKRRIRRGGILSSSMRYSMQTTSRENRLYNHPAAVEHPPEEESISGCEIYGRQEEILTYEQKKRFGLFNVHKSTQTPLETILYGNAQARRTIDDDPFQRRFKIGRGEQINTDYDYALSHHSVVRSISSQTNKYSCPVRRSKRRKSSLNSKSSRGTPRPCGRQRLSSPSSDRMDQISYIDPDLCNTCQFGEDALTPESEPASEADSDYDDTESSDYESDPPKILIDKKLIDYVKKLEKKHTVYIEKYRTPKRSSLKHCPKTVSLELPPVGPRRRANTGVLKLLDRKKTKVGKSFSIPVNIETVTCRPCPHNTGQAPKPCLSEEDYLKILS